VELQLDNLILQELVAEGLVAQELTQDQQQEDHSQVELVWLHQLQDHLLQERLVALEKIITIIQQDLIDLLILEMEGQEQMAIQVLIILVEMGVQE
jgi:hypothetical protein